jgi:DNA-binding NarL/FixJ family response regulator
MTAIVTVLIVDDDVPIRVGVRTILSLEPRIVVVGEAATGAEACTLALELEPDVILMDVHLPVFDGIEATRRITSGSKARGVRVPRVIVLTTFDFDEYVFRSLQAGASGFLLKRTRAEELVDAVLTVAAGNALPTPGSTTALVSRFTERSGDRAPLPSALTSRECDILSLVAQGLSNQEIGDALAISIETVRTHVKRVYAKLGARDRVHAVIAAYESGLVPRPPSA